MARFLAAGTRKVIGTRIEVPAWRPDTGEFPVELAVWARRDGNTWTFNAFVHDIRDRRRGEEALREAVERERANAARLSTGDPLSGSPVRVTLVTAGRWPASRPGTEPGRRCSGRRS